MNKLLNEGSTMYATLKTTILTVVWLSAVTAPETTDGERALLNRRPAAEAPGVSYRTTSPATPVADAATALLGRASQPFKTTADAVSSAEGDATPIAGGQALLGSVRGR